MPSPVPAAGARRLHLSLEPPDGLIRRSDLAVECHFREAKAGHGGARSAQFAATACSNRASHPERALMSLLAIPFPNIDPVAIALGPVSIKWYGLAYIAGLALGWLYIRKLLARPALWPGNRAPFTIDAVDDLFVWVTAGVVIGGRLGHVLFYEPAYYLSHPWQIPAVWNGGMSFHGGLAGTALALVAFARRNGVPMLSVMDAVAAAAPIGLLFGRLANFVNGEIVGSVTAMPWGMVFPHWGPEPRHPAMLYEAALEGVALFLILRYATHTRLALKTPGLTAGLFLIGYGAFRIFCELFKIVDYRLFTPSVPITKGMAYSVPFMLLGAAFILMARRKPLPAAVASSGADGV
jgi:phosphatidylglycerol:prolipoprotein diacylglycerol transferase